MDNLSGNVLNDLKLSFLEDKKNIQASIIEAETEINECREFIASLNKKEACDFNLFSPRSASSVYKSQIEEKTGRISYLEDELKSLYKKLSDVTKKIDSLSSINLDDIESNSSSVADANDYSEKLSYLKLQEDDRQRIAAELHDTVLQNLSLVVHNLELASKFIDFDSVRAKLELETDRKLVKDIIDEIRSTIFDLRPMQIDDFGFKRSIENLLETYSHRTSISIKYDICEAEDVDDLVLLTVFRIIQELVNNSIKHSNANNLFVSVIRNNSTLVIEVKDDGIGTDPDSLNKENHYGIKILKERVSMVNGVLHFPKVEQGFKVLIEIPVA